LRQGGLEGAPQVDQRQLLALGQGVYHCRVSLDIGLERVIQPFADVS